MLINNSKKIVIKIGSSTVIDKKGKFKKKWVNSLINDIKKYKGNESKQRIKIWGDNGILCRPYISNFEVGKYYLISPLQIKNSSEDGNKGDYDFFACWTDYLTVDYDNGIAYGEYSKRKNKITLKEFENGIKK